MSTQRYHLARKSAYRCKACGLVYTADFQAQTTQPVRDMKRGKNARSGTN